MSDSSSSANGYLLKRQNGVSPPSPTRVFCVLWGASLLDFESEEQADTMLPKLVTEVLGVSEWDDQTRGNQYRNGFLIVTTKGSEYHCWASSPEERQVWMMNIRRSVECHFANSEISPFHKSSKFIEMKPRHVRNLICPITKLAMAPMEKYTHTHVLGGTDIGSKTASSTSATKRNAMMDSDSLEDEMGENRVYSEREKVQQRIDLGLVTSDPPYICPALQLCTSCGRGYSSAEHVSEVGPPLLQLGQELPEKMCMQCSLTQSVILWFKTLNYINASEIHELTPEVNKEIRKFKDTFKLRRARSERLDMAACLLEEGNISMDEFQVLRELDDDYRREELTEEAGKLKAALDALGSDMQTILSLLLNPSATEKGGMLSYHYVILKILEIADDEGGAELVDFYFPQLVQVHLQECKSFTQRCLSKTDELQQCLLTLALKHPPLSTKLAWLLIASIEDYHEKPAPRITRAQYCGCMALLIQLEMIMTGYVSSLSDPGSSAPTCQLLLRMVQAAPHQQSELGFELSVLFLSRRKLQEMNQSQVLTVRRKKTGQVDIRESESSAEGEGGQKEEQQQQRDESPEKMDSSVDKADDPLSEADCVTIIKHLGVGGQGSEDEGGGSVLMPPHWESFSVQLDFLDKLTLAVDALREVERPDRTSTFQAQMHGWNEDGMEVLAARPATKGLAGLCGNARFGFDPVVTAGEPLYRVTKVLADDCRVFRTKARAPSLLVCEVVRENIYRELVAYSRDAFHAEATVHGGTAAAGEATTSTRRISGGGTERRGSWDSVRHTRTRSRDSEEGTSSSPLAAAAAAASSRPMSPPQSPVAGAAAGTGTGTSDGASSGGRRTTLIGSAAKQRNRTRTSSADAIFIAAINADGGPVPVGSGSRSSSSSSSSSTDERVTSEERDRAASPAGAACLDSMTSNFVEGETGTEDEGGSEVTKARTASTGSASSWVVQEKEAERDALKFIDSNIDATISMLFVKEKEEKARELREEAERAADGQSPSRPQAQARGDSDVSTPPLTQVSAAAASATTTSLPGSRDRDRDPKDRGDGSRGVGGAGKKTRPISGGPALLSATRKGTGAAFASLLHSASFGDLQLVTDDGTEADAEEVEEGARSRSVPSSPERQKARGRGRGGEGGADAGDDDRNESKVGPDSDSAADSSSSSSTSTSTTSEEAAAGNEDEERYNRIVRSANRLLASGQINQFEYKTLIASEARYQNELTTEKVEAFTRAEGSFGEPWESRKQRALRYHAANMPVGIIIGTLRSRVREALALEDEARDLGQQQQLTSPKRGGLLELSPIPLAAGAGVAAHGIALPQAQAQAQTPEPSLTSLHLASTAEKRQSLSLDKRRRHSASKPTGLEEWVESSNAGLGGGFDIDIEERDSERSRSRSSSIALTDGGGAQSPRLSQQKRLSDAFGAGSSDNLLVSPANTLARERAGSNLSLSGLSVTPVGVNTTWHEINSEDAKRQQSDRPLGSGSTPVPLVITGQPFGPAFTADSRPTTGQDEDDGEYACYPRVDLRAFIVKSNDDLRQEMVVLQLMRLCAEIWHDFGLDGQLYLRPYNIICTSNSTGVVEVVQDAMSLDALKKTDGFTTLPAYFDATYGTNAEVLHAAKSNFTRSLAAYSIFTYLLLIKDRHNGNILIGSHGHLMHIDFGFLLGIAPGGAFSLESAPFKLTEEFVEVMGGLESPMFTQFVRSFTTGMLALRTNSENIISTLRVVAQDSPFPCFAGKDVNAIIEKFRGRFRCELSTKGFAQHCLDLIIASYSHYGTRQYDSFQYYSNGIYV